MNEKEWLKKAVQIAISQTNKSIEEITEIVIEMVEIYENMKNI